MTETLPAVPIRPEMPAADPELVWENEGGHLRPRQRRCLPTQVPAAPRTPTAAAAVPTRGTHRSEPPITMRRAVTSALSAHPSTPDPQLFRLADALLATRHDYTTTTARDGHHRPADLHRARQRYADAALRYCAALHAHGLAPPPGLPDTAGWLATGSDTPA